MLDLAPSALAPVPGGGPLGLDSASLLLPAIGTDSGDFLDRISFDDGRETFVVGDVCGKGPAASRVAEYARRAIHDPALHAAPGATLEAANEALVSANLAAGDRGRFVSAIVAQVTPGTRRTSVDLASAGHPPAVVVRENGTIQRLGSTGMVLGVAPRISVGQRRVHLDPGDALLLYSDGATDVQGGGEVFGIDRLVGLARGCRGMGAAVMAASIHRAVLDFQQGVYGDDLAVTVISVPMLRY